MRTLRRWWPLAGPSLLVTAVALGAQFLPSSTQLQVRSVLVTTAIVVALYVFVGNSGVMSFGQVSFVAAGAFAAGKTRSIGANPCGSGAVASMPSAEIAMRRL